MLMKKLSILLIAINIIYKVFSENKEAFEEDMKRLCEKNPTAFYLKFIQPIQPKDVNLLSEDGPLRIEVVTKNK